MKNLNLEHRSVLPKTGQTTEYQAGDDGAHEAGNKASPRFVDNGDGTVTDNATQLMWIKDPVYNPGAPFNAVMNWANAIINCEALNLAGHTDWRLPNLKELISIVDYGSVSSIDIFYFPNILNGSYWSSTTWLAFTDSAWYVNFFFDGTVAIDDKVDAELYVRPVRLGG